MRFQVLFCLGVGLILQEHEQVAAVTGTGGAEIQVISNTNLLTGIQYQIGLPNYYFSALSWADVSVPENPGALFVELDDHEDRLGAYARGGKWFRDGIWFFKPSDTAGYYSIHGYKSGAEKILSVSSTEVSPAPEAPLDHYLILSSLDDIGKNYTLWEVLPAPEGVHTYQLRNLGLPGLAAVTLRFGTFYRYVRINLQADPQHLSFGETDSTILKFKAVGVDV